MATPINPSTTALAAFFNGTDAECLTALATAAPAQIRDALAAHDDHLFLARVLKLIAGLDARITEIE